MTTHGAVLGILASLLVFLLCVQVDRTYEAVQSLAEQDSAVIRQMDEVYDALRCERTAEFPTADGADRTIVVFVCRNGDTQ